VRIFVVVCAWLLLAPPRVAAAAEGAADAGAAEPDSGAPSGDASPDAAAAPDASPTPPRPAQAADGERPGRPPARPISPAVPAGSPVSVKQGAPPRSAWPIESVLRPQTIPAGYLRLTVSTAALLTAPSYRSATGRAYGNSYQAGATMTMGATDRVEFSTYVPKILCGGSGAVNACSDYARFNGAGFGFVFGVARTRAVQVALGVNLDVALTNPFTVEAWASGSAKLLLEDHVALALGLSASHWIDPPPFYDPIADTAYGFVEVDLQLARHLLAWSALEPSAPFGHSDQRRLGARGGLTWTFENAAELGASGGVYSVLPRRPEDLWVPGGSVIVSLRVWL